MKRSMMKIPAMLIAVEKSYFVLINNRMVMSTTKSKSAVRFLYFFCGIKVMDVARQIITKTIAVVIKPVLIKSSSNDHIEKKYFLSG